MQNTLELSSNLFHMKHVAWFMMFWNILGNPFVPTEGSHNVSIVETSNTFLIYVIFDAIILQLK